MRQRFQWFSFSFELTNRVGPGGVLIMLKGHMKDWFQVASSGSSESIISRGGGEIPGANILTSNIKIQIHPVSLTL